MLAISKLCQFDLQKTTAKKECQDKTLDCSSAHEDSVKQQGDFTHFRITEPTKEFLHKQGINYLFPIQIKTFNHVYDGDDLIAQASKSNPRVGSSGVWKSMEKKFLVY